MMHASHNACSSHKISLFLRQSRFVLLLIYAVELTDAVLQ